MGRGKQQQQSSQEYSQEQKQEQKVQIRRPKIQRIDKFKTLKRIVINVSMTQYPVVSEVAEQLGWKIQSSNEAGDWDVFWTDFSVDPDILIKMHLFQKINHYPGIHVIARKNLLGLSLMALRGYFPEEYNFFPLTWMLPLQYAEFRTYFEGKPKGKARTYIVKPQADCQGRGIFLTRKLQDLQNGKHYVVQRYLARPYLLQGLKFDLRIYVLLCGTNPLRLYMYNQGLARLATEQYVQPSSGNLQQQYMHLTNYAINKNNPKFIFNSNSGNMGVGHKRSLSCVFKQLAGRGIDVEELKRKINDVAIKTVICGLPLMGHQYKCSQPEDYAGNMCFHILGLDIMMNAKGEPVLLEVNHTPSFTTDTPLDHKIKFNLIKDSLELMNVNVQTKTELFNRAKELNQQRLLTGKRQIYQGREREEVIADAQAARDQYQDKHLGGFERIFPLKDENIMKKYSEIIEAAQKIYAEENGSIRMKMMEKEAKKLIREDFKQRKREKAEQKEKDKESKETLEAKEGREVKQSKESREGKKDKQWKQRQRDTASQPSGQCPSPPCKPHFNSEHYLPPSSQSVDQREQQSVQMSSPPPNMTKSQHVIDISSELIEVSLVKRFSDREQKQRQSSNSMIKIKKLQASLQTGRKDTQPKQGKNAEDANKATPQHPKKVVRQNGRNVPSYMYQNTNFTPVKQERNKSNVLVKGARKINTRGVHDQLPNIIDNMVVGNDTGLVRRQEKLLSLQKGNLRTDSKNGRIYEHIARDIREMIDRKNGTSGGYVMPKLINLNIENERRATEHPPNLMPYRKANPSIILYANSNE